jgi:CBS domain-containing protein
MSVLASTLLGAVSELRKGKVVVIPSSLDVHEAAGILSSHVISSAPVVHEDSGEFLGMFDFMDLIALVLAAFQKDSLAEIDLTDKALDLAKFLNDMANVSHVTHAPIASVVDLSKHKPTPVMKHSESLAKVFQLFSSGTKRVLVTGEKAQEIVGIFSQSDAVKFVDKNKSSFGSVLSKTIDELKIAEKEVMTVLDSASVLDALQVMFRNNISGVAIVTKTGRMVGSISMTDLKVIQEMTRFFMTL